MATILVIEDEAVLAEGIKRTLEKVGHAVSVAPTGRAGLQSFAELRPDLTLLDLHLPDARGLDLLPQLAAPGANVVIMTAYATVEDAVRAIKLGARDYLQKPLNMDDLRHTVGRVLEESQLRSVLSYYRERETPPAGIDGILGSCPQIEELRERLRRLCALPGGTTPPTVLVTGETGTGKGLVARTLHYAGPRADRPFIEVNCAAIPEALVESELFGHERGAFTDAKSARGGLFQAGDRGTLFLDEVGCLPVAIQVKLLKAIEEKTVRPVGARSERSIDVQIVAATNSDLDSMVRSGAFREDLFYRLRVAPLDVPPLRERGDDIELLTDTFLAELVARYRVSGKTLPAETRALIRTYPWPGNVRELRNTLDRAVLFGKANDIDPGALALPSASTPTRIYVSPESRFEFEIPDAGLQFEDLERAFIVAALRKAGGSPAGAARLLGMTRDTMRYRIEKFGIEAAS
jgi:DNA-binding NtrC family response regulator